MTPPPARRLPAADVSEMALIVRAQAGDVDAFQRLAGAHADRLYAVLLRLLGDRADAEDVAQETLLRAWRGIGRFQHRSQFFTWLYRIAINEANRFLQKSSRRPRGGPIDEAGSQVAGAASEQPPQRLERQELLRILDRALLELPRDHRVAIVLRDVEGLSTTEAAEIAGIGEAAFKSRLHQARLKVRAELGDEALIAAGGG